MDKSRVRLGYVGLGKMGFNMVERLLEKKYAIVVFDTNEEAGRRISKAGAQPVQSLSSLPGALSSPRLIWLMVPHEAVDAVIDTVAPLLEKGDTVIDGGNSPYKDSMRRAEALKARGVDFLDAGVSGGPGGARNGACIMVGGEQRVFKRFETLFRDLSVEGGFAYMGKSGAGHFVKMIHNGIEYGMMQALAEGFAVMKASPFDLDLAGVATIYNHRSVIESRLVEWLKRAFEKYGEDLKEISGAVSSTGEGGWTVEAAKELGISVPIIEGAVRFREGSQGNPTYTGQVLSALRNLFGSHDVFKKEG
ncbi:MAG: 6-phosphogluconate dehydrogenase, decarboxylating [Syntrophorhabdus sp. PtaU1.Bin153]|nr:MAG: 6-phosphogluconate dehydrogenase, decarboxylating [Syntrophorhabdus sp. PtaU1.Bin153]